MQEVHSRKKERKPMRKGSKIAIIIIAVLFTLVLAAGAVGLIYLNKVYNLRATEAEDFEESDVYVNPELFETEEETETVVHNEVVDIKPQATEDESDYTMIMIYGVDTTSKSDTAQYGNGDSEIICCINNDTKEVKLVSLLRDTFVETTTGKHNKLTDIYSAYGVKESMGTINKCFDLQITKYVSINWTMMAKAVNALGGVDIQLSSAEIAYIQRAMPPYTTMTGVPHEELVDKGPGVYHLDGIAALAHAANRTIGQHDISRAQRQRTILKAMLAQAKTCSFEELNNAITEIMPGISTNLGLVKILDMALDVKKYTISESTVFPFDYRDQNNLRTAYVYCTTLSENVTQLHEYLFGDTNYKPTSTVESVSDYITSYRKEHP